MEFVRTSITKDCQLVWKQLCNFFEPATILIALAVQFTDNYLKGHRNALTEVISEFAFKSVRIIIFRRIITESAAKPHHQTLLDVLLCCSSKTESGH